MNSKLKIVLSVAISAVVLAGCGGGGAPTSAGSGVAQQPNSAVVANTGGYSDNVPFPVSVSVVPDNTSIAYAVEDVPPAGWTVTNINESGVFDASTRKVKWGVFFDNCPRVFTYTATPPPGTTGSQTFAGILSVNGKSFPLTGQRSVFPSATGNH